MKNFLMVTLCLALSVTAFAQKPTPAKEKKPTKQETMDWIAGKMKENLGLGREFVSYSNGKFVYKKEWKAFVYCVTTIDLNKVTGMSSEYATDVFVSGKGIVSTLCDDEAKTTSFPEYISISGPNYEDYSAPFNFTPDQALVERLKKAFTTLIEFNSVKKAEGESF